MFAFEEASYALVLEDANGKPEPFDDAGFLFARSDLPAKAALVLGLEAMRGWCEFIEACKVCRSSQGIYS
jgi:hypothetical protein